MIEINNLTSFPVDKKVFSTVAKKVLKGENRRTETLSLAFVGKEEMRRLNRKFRKKNKATDVLSFGLKEGKFLGEIVICPEVVKKDAGKFKVSVKSEMLKVFVHGILHLCGYDHEDSAKDADEMEAKEKAYLQNNS